MDLVRFNSTLEPQAQKRIVTFDDYKLLHGGKKTAADKLTYEATIASIESVEKKPAGYIIKFNGGKELSVLYNGMTILTENGNTTYGGYDPFGNNHRNLDKGHFRVNLNGQSFIIEKLIGICECILADKLPDSFNGLTVNVKDGSGNIYTAEYLGIKPDYSLDNLEWTLNLDNLSHGRIIKGMYKRTGHVYRFSANDTELYQLYQTKDTTILKKYCSKLYKVK